MDVYASLESLREIETTFVFPLHKPMEHSIYVFLWMSLNSFGVCFVFPSYQIYINIIYYYKIVFPFYCTTINFYVINSLN